MLRESLAALSRKQRELARLGDEAARRVPDLEVLLVVAADHVAGHGAAGEPARRGARRARARSARSWPSRARRARARRARRRRPARRARAGRRSRPSRKRIQNSMPRVAGRARRCAQPGSSAARYSSCSVMLTPGSDAAVEQVGRCVRRRQLGRLAEHVRCGRSACVEVAERGEQARTISRPSWSRRRLAGRDAAAGCGRPRCAPRRARSRPGRRKCADVDERVGERHVAPASARRAHGEHVAAVGRAAERGPAVGQRRPRSGRRRSARRRCRRRRGGSVMVVIASPRVAGGGHRMTITREVPRVLAVIGSPQGRPSQLAGGPGCQRRERRVRLGRDAASRSPRPRRGAARPRSARRRVVARLGRARRP